MQRLEDVNDRFKAIYIAYEACKTSFKRHCRRLIGLDGCHLKGQTKGILLTAIGLDPNDQIFPIAFAVVRIENADTWNWFLGLLVQDMEIMDSSKWTFISDRQKGLINALRNCCPHAEHRMCVWHMHNNFKKLFPSTILKDLIWEAARATNIYGFEKAMNELKEENEQAYKWLADHTTEENWSRAFFGSEAKYDILVNNISECYNKVLLFAREKPLYGMLECIRMYLMDRFTTRRKMGARLEDAIGPKIRKKLEKTKEKIGECMVREAGEWIYQVNTKWNDQFVVDLWDRTCSCRRWMLTGLPCQHAIAAIEMTSENVDDFVAKCYSKETFKMVYEAIIYLVQGPQQWTKTAHPNVIPPELTKLPGRPKGARQKSVQEAREMTKEKARAARIVQVRDDIDGGQKLSRKRLMMDYKCRLCSVVGHNRRRCPQREPAAPSIPKRTKGKERQRGEEKQKCTLCHQPDHNRVWCQIVVADMFVDQPSSAAGDNQATSSTVKKN
ncbi:uncharacterized protein LOC121745872 [Salvia splendens]|uniref:uncharacterized protein LOC121745872 n=1 Tax=Salvia splendens TaxID=180675 RepID=UPI001C273442|nr:uncharacterized protein LOC121745872 [Salvia splendens]